MTNVVIENILCVVKKFTFKCDKGTGALITKKFNIVFKTL